MKTVKCIKQLLRGCPCDGLVSLEKIGDIIYLKVDDEYLTEFDPANW